MLVGKLDIPATPNHRTHARTNERWWSFIFTKKFWGCLGDNNANGWDVQVIDRYAQEI